jgi:hypothetical protein
MLRKVITVRFALIFAVLVLLAMLIGEMPWGPA